MWEIDVRSFDALDDDEQKISDDCWVPCICQEVFFQLRLITRYCNTCKQAFCEGEHGFAALCHKRSLASL